MSTVFSETATKTCPRCRSEIHPEATKCPHCQSDLRQRQKMRFRPWPLMAALLLTVLVVLGVKAYDGVERRKAEAEIGDCWNDWRSTSDFTEKKFYHTACWKLINQYENDWGKRPPLP